MRYEGVYRVLFVILAIVAVILISPVRERFVPPMDPLVRTTQLEEDIKLLEERTGKLEEHQQSQDDEMKKAQNDIDAAATDVDMVTA
jgi:hypothetical protein